jgi:hypothetical protein
MICELRKDLSYGLPGVLARRDGGQFRMGMREQQSDEFFARVTGSADDGDFFHDRQY